MRGARRSGEGLCDDEDAGVVGSARVPWEARHCDEGPHISPGLPWGMRSYELSPGLRTNDTFPRPDTQGSAASSKKGVSYSSITRPRSKRVRTTCIFPRFLKRGILRSTVNRNRRSSTAMDTTSRSDFSRCASTAIYGLPRSLLVIEILQSTYLCGIFNSLRRLPVCCGRL